MFLFNDFRLALRPVALLCLALLMAFFPASIFADTTSSDLQNIFLVGTPAAVYLPAKITPGQPVQLLIALHGLGGNGPTFCKGLLAYARANNLAVLAPTFSYNPDWHNPQVIAEEDTNLTALVNRMAGDFEKNYGLKLSSRYLLYGFSRGAQLAHRFALLYPEKTLGAVVLSAGSYTLPLESKNNQLLNFPFGIADLQKWTGRPFNKAAFRKVQFLIGAGSNDTDPQATPAAWNSYIGKGRLERAQNFYNTLKQAGYNASFDLFPDTGHQDSPAMQEAATRFYQTIAARPIQPEPNAIYFGETGHNLNGAFRQYWQKFGGLAQFGYPLTEAFDEVNSEDGKIYSVQYFQRARFELHPENAGTDYEILLGLLGKQIAPSKPVAPPNSGQPDQTYFAEIGHNLGGAFYQYWLKHGGLPIYGYPLTEPFMERNSSDGKTYLVQYFERNRFELHPENAGTDYEVLLGLLGLTIATKNGLLPVAA